MSLSDYPVLVTGGDGWLGSRLVQALAGVAGPLPGGLSVARRVRCLVLPGREDGSLRSLSPAVEVVRGNVESAGDCERLCEGAKGGTLFHTAGVIHPRRVAEFYRVNVDGTCHLLDAAIQAGIKRAVVVSSNSPCGCNPHPDHLFDEFSPYRPYLNYGRSKMLMEHAVQARHASGRIETVIVRPPWFYGPNQPARQSLFFRMIRLGKVPVVGSGRNLRSMSYVDNLCQGLILAATVDRANGQTYWIADRRPYSMNEIIDQIERLLENEFGFECAHRRVRLPGFFSRFAFCADAAVQGLGLYHQKIHVLSEMNKTIACSVRRAEDELGYRPQVELEEGMRRSLAWCREAGHPI